MENGEWKIDHSTFSIFYLHKAEMIIFPSPHPGLDPGSPARKLILLCVSVLKDYHFFSRNLIFVAIASQEVPIRASKSPGSAFQACERSS